MSQRVRKKQQGFTLIELSIVLVIIGLIVGGVLVGQDLVKAYWERLRGERAMPSESDINPEGAIDDMWDDCFLIHASDINKEDYNFIYVGDNIKMVLSGGMYEDPAELWKSLNVKRMAPDLQKVLDTKAPVIHEGETVNDANQLVKYRQCLLPIGEGDKVLAIFGGMRCKIYL